ncbi:DUF4347 domain-containing protein, partial [Sagittula sp. SSi028]|uniref:DUF4347 domain-containing protein n=1 Tax=Sagittula sp. SSi028 TaxID=3400636 RepID=UPI003AF5D26D
MVEQNTSDKPVNVSQKTHKPDRNTSLSWFQTLEPRLVFDAAFGAEAVDTIGNHNSGSEEAFTNRDLNTHLAESLAHIEPKGERLEVYVIDGQVADAGDLIAAVPARSHLITLDGNSSGLAQIEEGLSGLEGIDALHILSHGEPGEIQLGPDRLETTNLSIAELEALQRIGGQMALGGDILIYGCDFADAEDALSALAVATGADVVGSDDKTGSAALGGDWDLEANVGAIEADTLAVAAFSGTLADFTDAGTDTDYTLSGTDTLTITSGTYTGEIDGFGPNTTITVEAGASFEPASFDGLRGTLIIEAGATAVIDDVNFEQNFTLQNSGDLVFSGSAGFDDTAELSNFAGGTIIFSEILTLEKDSILTNAGTLTFNEDLETKEDTTFSNSGSVTLTTLSAEGDIVNSGYIDATQIIEINDTSAVTNTGSLEAATLFENKSNSFANDGFIFVTGGSSIFLNDGTFTGGPDSVVTGFNFENAGQVDGGGSYSFDGLTANTGDFDGTGGQTINFVDNSPTGANIFDIQTNAPTNTQAVPFTPPAAGTLPGSQVNPDPVAGDDTFAVDQGTTGNPLDLLGNDADADGDSLSVRSIDGVGLVDGAAFDISVTGGTVSWDGAGNLTFADDNTAQTATFEYEITDGNGGVDTASVTIDINSVPLLSNDLFAGIENQNVTIALFNNDTNPSGDTPTVVELTNLPPVTSGVLTYLNNGVRTDIDPANPPVLTFDQASSLIFEPADFFFTTTGNNLSFDYTVTDADGDTDTATVEISIAAVNDNPIIDLNSASDINDADRGLDVTFVEEGVDASGVTQPGTPVSLVDANADISSLTEDDIVTLTIDVPSNPEGEDEIVTLNGFDYPLNAAAAAVQTVTYGGTTFDVSYNGFTFTVQATGSTGSPVDEADLTSLIKDLTYRNENDNAEQITREFVFVLTDQSGSTGTATASVTVTLTNDTPEVNLDPDNLSLGADDGNYDTLISAGTQNASIVPAGGGVISSDGDDLETLTITPGGNADGADESLTVFGTDGSQVDIALDGTPVSGSVSINGQSFDVAYDGTDVVITVTGGGPAATDDFNALLEGIGYSNDAVEATLGERTFDISVADSQLSSTILGSTLDLNLVQFQITGEGYTFSAANGSTASTIEVVRFNNTTGEYELQNAVQMDVNVNATGFNINDQYGYGIVNNGLSSGVTARSIIRIGADGEYVDLGQPTNTDPTGDPWSTIRSTNAGVIGDDGTYFTRTGPNTLAIVEPLQGLAAGDSFSFTEVASNINIAIDLAFGQDGALYGIQGNNLVRYEVTYVGGIATEINASVVTTVPDTSTPNASVRGGFGGAWSDLAGRLFFYNNGGQAGTERTIIQIELDYDTTGGVVGAPTTGTVTDVGVSEQLSTFDAFAAKGFDRGDAPGYVEATHNLDPVGVKLGTEITDGEVAGTQNVSAEADEVTGFDDEDGYSGSLVIPAASGDTYTISAGDFTISNPSGATTAKLHAWIDWDADGVFETGEGVDYDVADVVSDGAGGWTLSSDLVFTVPATISTTEAQTYMRFRISTDDRISATTPGALDASGSPVLSTAAVDGEVEDYRVFLNAPPVLTPDVNTTFEDTALVVNRNVGLLSNDTDPNSDSLRVSGLSADIDGSGTQTAFSPNTFVTLSDANGEIGQLRIRGNGAYHFTPAANYFGPVPTITYEVTDARGVSSTSTLNITVDGVPDTSNDRLETPENVAILVNATDNDFDALGDGPAEFVLDELPPLMQGSLSYDTGTSILTLTPGSGPFRLTAAEFATLTFTPAEDFVGSVDRFSYTVVDTDGTASSPDDDEQSTSTISITVTDTPDATPDSYVTAEDTAVSLDLEANDDTGSGLSALVIGS